MFGDPATDDSRKECGDSHNLTPVRRIARIHTMLPVALLLLNDGWMPMQGSELSLREHPDVRMVRERVEVTVSAGHAVVDCRFEFRNEGRACTVTMAFPDDTDRDEPSSTFKWFKSWVDGKFVPTDVLTVENGKMRFEVRKWRVKRVAFQAGQTRAVRDRYQVANSVSHLVHSSVQGFDYILRTGSTWKGRITRSEVVITFAADALSGSPRAMNVNRVPRSGSTADLEAFWKKHASWIAYSGPSRPTLSGRTLRFVRSNWEPNQDVHLTFGWRKDAKAR